MTPTSLSLSPLVSKIFAFQDQSSLTYQTIQILLSENLQQIDIQQVIRMFTHKNAITQLPLTYKIYNPESNEFVSFDHKKPLEKQFMFCPVIMIKYMLIKENHHTDSNPTPQVSPLPSPSPLCNNPSHHDHSFPSFPSNPPKKQRNKQRTIRQVLLSVKQWRKIHNNLDQDLVSRVSLQDAAKMVGISKKSLDDYFSVLRLAEEYGFDFEGNMDEKMGVIRGYVKKERGKRRGGHKQEKLLKRLRVFEEIGQLNDFRMVQQEQVSDSELSKNKVQGINKSKITDPFLLTILPQQIYYNKFDAPYNLGLDQDYFLDLVVPFDSFNILHNTCNKFAKDILEDNQSIIQHYGQYSN